MECPLKPDRIEEVVEEFWCFSNVIWSDIFDEVQDEYNEPQSASFNTQTVACGYATPRSGPFYCPQDQTVYVDTSFINNLDNYGAYGVYAVVYVLAHEVGHHVQTLRNNSIPMATALSQPIGSDYLRYKRYAQYGELQADCYAAQRLTRGISGPGRI